jgi:hypothetical protein
MTERDHLELFMYRVSEMRKLQKRYFAGEHGLLHECRKAEKLVDVALSTLCSSLGYSMQEVEKKYQQKKMF